MEQKRKCCVLLRLKIWWLINFWKAVWVQQANFRLQIFPGASQKYRVSLDWARAKFAIYSVTHSDVSCWKFTHYNSSVILSLESNSAIHYPLHERVWETPTFYLIVIPKCTYKWIKLNVCASLMVIIFW